MCEPFLGQSLSTLFQRARPRISSHRFLRIHRPIATATATASAVDQQSAAEDSSQWTPYPLKPTKASISRLDALRNSEPEPFSAFLTDNHSRHHNYLRISLTEKCNLRCLYCMPEEGVPLSPNSTQLTTPEIVYLSSLFVDQGVNKIRLTGGEPTVRKDIVPLMRRIGDLRQRGLRELCITTNGVALHRKLDAMAEAGLTGVNLSLDTLDPFQFQIMTRRTGYEAVMRSIDRILEMNNLGAGIKLKINCVVMRGLNEREILPFVEMGREKDIEVRFIEYMPFDGNKWSQGKMVSYQEMLSLIREKYPNLQRLRDHANDTSKTYQVPGFVGRVGFITSMTHNFCGTCNRLRITSDGNLKVCLFGNAEVSLRDVLRQSNEGRPIDDQAMEALNRLEPNRLEDLQRSTGSLPLSDRETRLLDLIGAAVKRKKAKHAGMGELENMKNRPMILIGRQPRHLQSAITSTKRAPSLSKSGFPRLPVHLLPACSSISPTARFYSAQSQALEPAPSETLSTEDPSSSASHENPDNESNAVQESHADHNGTEKSQSSSETPMDDSSLEMPWVNEMVSDEHEGSSEGTLAADETLVVDEKPSTNRPPSMKEIAPLKGSFVADDLSSTDKGLTSNKKSDPEMRSMETRSIDEVSIVPALFEPTAAMKPSIVPPKPPIAPSPPGPSSRPLSSESTSNPNQSRPETGSQSKRKSRKEDPSKSSSLPTSSTVKQPPSKLPATDVSSPSLPHLTSAGHAHMVSITDKPLTHRTAIAKTTIRFSNQTPYNLLTTSSLPKGDALATARIAGIQAAKRTADLIPLAHPSIGLTHVAVDLDLRKPSPNSFVLGNQGAVTISARVDCVGRTGVEMEALTAATVAGLTVFDMCKAVDKGIRMMGTKVVYKSGGRSGTWVWGRAEDTLVPQAKGDDAKSQNQGEIEIVEVGERPGVVEDSMISPGQADVPKPEAKPKDGKQLKGKERKRKRMREAWEEARKREENKSIKTEEQEQKPKNVSALGGVIGDGTLAHTEDQPARRTADASSPSPSQITQPIEPPQDSGPERPRKPVGELGNNAPLQRSPSETKTMLSNFSSQNNQDILQSPLFDRPLIKKFISKTDIPIDNIGGGQDSQRLQNPLKYLNFDEDKKDEWGALASDDSEEVGDDITHSTETKDSSGEVEGERSRSPAGNLRRRNKLQKMAYRARLKERRKAEREQGRLVRRISSRGKEESEYINVERELSELSQMEGPGEGKEATDPVVETAKGPAREFKVQYEGERLFSSPEEIDRIKRDKAEWKRQNRMRPWGGRSEDGEVAGEAKTGPRDDGKEPKSPETERETPFSKIEENEKGTANEAGEWTWEETDTEDKSGPERPIVQKPKPPKEEPKGDQEQGGSEDWSWKEAEQEQVNNAGPARESGKS